MSSKISLLKCTIWSFRDQWVIDDTSSEYHTFFLKLRLYGIYVKLVSLTCIFMFHLSQLSMHFCCSNVFVTLHSLDFVRQICVSRGKLSIWGTFYVKRSFRTFKLKSAFRLNCWKWVPKAPDICFTESRKPPIYPLKSRRIKRASLILNVQYCAVMCATSICVKIRVLRCF